MVLIFLYPILRGDLILFILAYAAFFAYFAVPNIFSLTTPNIADRNFPRALPTAASLIYGGIICYFLHGLSGISAVGLSIGATTGRPINKGKTLMKSV